MSIDTKITVSGWVGTQPRHVVTQNGTSFTVFRLGSTKRYFDRSQESWVDGATTWYTVKSWRTAAVNVAESLRRSDPVVVHGTFATETWESPDGPRTTLVVEADALGPDLTRGQATFRHTVHLSTATSRAAGPVATGAAATGAGAGAASTSSTSPVSSTSSSSGEAAEPGPGLDGGPDSLGVPGLTVVDDPWATGGPAEPDGSDHGHGPGEIPGAVDDGALDGASPVPAPPETDPPMSA